MTWPVHDAAPLPEGAKHRPGPAPDMEQAPFWEAAADGRLLVQRCEQCGAAQLYGRAWCRRCHGPVRWEAASGLGRVHTFTVVRQHHSRSFRHLVPYVVALVDLDEGARLMTNVVGVDPDDMEVGLRVQVRFERSIDGAVLPLFEPSAG